MSTNTPGSNEPDETDRLAAEFIRLRVEPGLPPSEDGKYVAVAVGDNDFEVNANGYQAITRLRERHPDAKVWLGRVGRPTACTMRNVK